MIRTLFINLFFLFQISLFSQDIRGGDLSIRNIFSYKYETKIFLYTSNPPFLYRPYLLFDWGIQVDTLFFSNQTTLTPNVIRSEYIGEFTFPTNGVYIVRYVDSFRIAGITNIMNSSYEKFELKAEIVINPLLGFNNTAIVFSYQTNVNENNGVYTFNPNLLEPDGDSLFCKIIPCYSNNYYTPDSIFINQSNGSIFYISSQTGLYAIAYEIQEWKKSGGVYYYAGKTTHDMLIYSNTTVDIEKNNELSKIAIYPIPAASNITIESTNTELSGIKIIDVLGKEIKYIKTPTNKTEIDISQLPSGIYILQMQSKNGMVSKKFVKE